jgi:hypothetical protein
MSSLSDLSDYNIKDVCEHLADNHDYQSLAHLAQTDQHINQICQPLLLPLKLEYVMGHLNILGPMYHSWFGFGLDLKYQAGDDGYEYVLLQDIKNGYATIYDHVSNQPLPSDTLFDYDSGTMDALYDAKKINQLANQKIPFQEVIIKNPIKQERVPSIWYNEPSCRPWGMPDHGIFHSTSHGDIKVLSLEKTRPYIHVIDHFQEVHLSSVDKGQPLTFDDVLFGTRPLMWDATRLVDGGYHVIEYDNDRLVIDPAIDNWST